MLDNDGVTYAEQARARYRDREVYALPRLNRIRSPHHRMHFGVLGVILAALLAVVGLGAWVSQYEYGTETSVVFTVKALGNNASGSSHEYIVFTEVPGTHTPAEVFKDTDAWFHGKWNSSNLYNFLTVGETYRCTVYGIRSGFLSSYRDLLTCKSIGLTMARGRYRGELVKPVSS